MDNDQEFKVVDKRRFNESGETLLKKDEDTSLNQNNKQDMNIQPEEKNNSDKIDFASFLVGVYSQTLIFLGDIPNPETGLVSKNIEAAKQNIDILAILEEKTKGNLSEEEENLINEILNNLRMIFVKKF